MCFFELPAPKSAPYSSVLLLTLWVSFQPPLAAQVQDDPPIGRHFGIPVITEVEAQPLGQTYRIGKHAVVDRAREMGFDLEAHEIDSLMEDFKELADRKKRVFDSDLEALITGHQVGLGGPWRLQWLSVVSRVSHDEEPTASLTLAHDDGTTSTKTGEGDGPVDAIVQALVIGISFFGLTHIGNHSGASFNPVLSAGILTFQRLASSATRGLYTYLFAYLVGPFIGSILAALFFCCIKCAGF